MKRLIYAFDTIVSARAQIVRLRRQGMGHEHMSLMARPDIVVDRVPSYLIDASMDVLPAIGRGAAFGGASGFLAGLVAVMVMPWLGIPASGFTLFAFVVLGILIGTWSAGMVGASIPNKVQRRFDKEINAGHILLVIDAPEAEAECVKKTMAASEPHQLWQGEVDQIAK